MRSTARLLPWVAYDRLGAAIASRLRGPGLIAWPVAVLAAIRIALVARFPDTHALVDDWFEHANYFGVFALGVLLARETGVWDEIRRQRWIALGLALVGYGVVTAYFAHFEFVDAAPPQWMHQGQRVFYALDQWCAIVAALGFARQWNPADSRVRRYLTEAIFPFYIVHQTAIVLLARRFTRLAGVLFRAQNRTRHRDHTWAECQRGRRHRRVSAATDGGCACDRSDGNVAWPCSPSVSGSRPVHA